MKLREYHAALERLSLKPCAIETSKALGLSIRQLHRIAHGHSKVPQPIAQLLKVLSSDGRQRFEPVAKIQRR